MVIELTTQNIIPALYFAINCFIAGDYHGSERPQVQNKTELMVHYTIVSILILVGFEIYAILHLVFWISKLFNKSK